MPVVLAGLPAFALAALAMLAAISLDWLVRTISKALGKFGVGPFSIDLGSIFYNVASGAIGWAVNDGKAFFVDVGNWFLGHEYIFKNLMFQTVRAITHVGDQIAHLYNDVIPQAEADAKSWASAELSRVYKGIESDISGAAATAASALSAADRSIYTTISGDVSTLKGDIVSAVSSGVNEAEDFTTKAIAALKTYVDGQVASTARTAADATTSLSKSLGSAISGVATDAAQDLSAAEKTLTTEIDTVGATAASDLADTAKSLSSSITSVADADAKAVSQAEQDASNEVTGLSNAVTGEIASTASGLSNTITSSAQAVEGDLTNLKVVLSAAIASAVGAVAIRVAKLEECSVGVCDDSPNNFSNLLQDALGVAEFAGVFAFLSEIVKDPSGAESDYSGLIQGLYGTGHDLFDSLLSL
jgi:hypothetical protein